jgi:hypothetical protein
VDLGSCVGKDISKFGKFPSPPPHQRRATAVLCIVVPECAYDIQEVSNRGDAFSRVEFCRVL